MKKYVVLLLALTLVGSMLVACGGPAAPATPATPAAPAAPGTADPAPAAEIDFPTRAITLKIPFAPGGGTDLTGRMIVPYLEEYLGVPITVINPTGASGWVAWEQMLGDPANGYTFAMINSPALQMGWLDPDAGRPHISLDNFTPLGMHNIDYWTLIAQAGRWESIEQFLEYASNNEVTIAATGFGTPGSMVIDRMMYHFDLNLSLVPFAGWGEVYPALLGGHVDIGTGGIGESMIPVRDGELEVLAVFAPERLSLFPDTPTWNEIFPDNPIEVSSARGFGIHADTDPAIVEILASAIEFASNHPDGIALLTDLGAYVVYMPPAEHREFLLREEAILREMYGVNP